MFFLASNLIYGANTVQLSGSLEIKIPGFKPSAQTPVVVYLEAKDPTQVFDVSQQAEIITQDSATFSPAFLPVAVGQVVNMPNNDSILHNVFSYSKGNIFDLGLYPQGESRQVVFQNTGLVRIYCSIHQSMQGSIFVSPTPFMTLVNLDGSWLIQDIPVGSYTLKTFSEWLPGIQRELMLTNDKDVILELGVLEESKI